MTQVEIDSDGDAVVDETTSYTYDDRGLRVSETTGTDTRTYLFDTQNLTGYAKPIEEHLNSVLDRTYTLGHQIISQHDSVNGALTFVQDGHGSTRALVDASGQVLQVMAYEAHGNVIEGAGLTGAADVYTVWLQPDGARDETTGFNYNLERWYDPRGGRFITSDPYAGNNSDPVSLHKYLYAHANPIMGIDPTGRFLAELTQSNLIRLGLISLTGGAIGGAAMIGANFALGRPLTQGLGFGIGFGAVALPLGVAFPPLGIALVGYGLFNASSVLYTTWANPRSSVAQKGVATLLFAAAGTGMWGAVRYQMNVGGWYNPQAIAARSQPLNPLTTQSTLAEHFPIIPNNAYIHVTPSQPASFSAGVNPKTFFFRFGDVRHLTVSQLRGLVGDLAPGGSQNAGNFVILEPTAAVQGALRPIGPPLMGQFQQYWTTSQIEPSVIGFGSVRSSE